MKVKCIHDTGKFLSKKFIDMGWTRESRMDLQINATYTVYGICYCKNVFKYLIAEQNIDPFWLPDEIFEIVDHKISILWFFDKFGDDYGIEALWGYNELISNEDHYDNLINRKKEDLDIFYKRKREMDLEFPDKSIQEKAVAGNNHNLMCPLCFETWESDSILGMIECPKCKAKLHNPKYAHVTVKK